MSAGDTIVQIDDEGDSSPAESVGMQDGDEIEELKAFDVKHADALEIAILDDAVDDDASSSESNKEEEDWKRKVKEAENTLGREKEMISNSQKKSKESKTKGAGEEAGGGAADQDANQGAAAAPVDDDDEKYLENVSKVAEEKRKQLEAVQFKNPHDEDGTGTAMVQTIKERVAKYYEDKQQDSKTSADERDKMHFMAWRLTNDLHENQKAAEEVDED
mmetsp:Transcript_62990/g.144957  ORF Transcript_62990/g.144957 Transcript_62990/m.144957 type:complete len:218 (-) Transcript_62990:170-823(-)